MDKDELQKALVAKGQSAENATKLANALAEALGAEEPTAENIAKALEDVVVASEERDAARTALKDAKEKVEDSAKSADAEAEVIWVMKDGTRVTTESDAAIQSMAKELKAVSYTHLTLPTTPYV